MRLTKFMIAGLIALLATPVWAQTPETVRIRVRGTVDALDGQKLVVKARSGDLTEIAFPPGTPVLAMVKKSLADIQSGDFVGVTSMRGADGRMNALEVHIFPEAMRGTNEGQFAWDLGPDTTMTNGAITGSASAPDGRTLKVNHKGVDSEITVSPQTSIVAYAPGDAGLLVPGATVLVQAVKQPDGSLTATRVNAEKDGVKPPM
jgi:hypothetical protein